MNKKTEKLIRQISVDICIEHNIPEIYANVSEVKKSNPIVNALAFMEEAEKRGYVLIKQQNGEHYA